MHSFQKKIVTLHKLMGAVQRQAAVASAKRDETWENRVYCISPRK